MHLPVKGVLCTYIFIIFHETIANLRNGELQFSGRIDG